MTRTLDEVLDHVKVDEGEPDVASIRDDHQAIEEQGGQPRKTEKQGRLRPYKYMTQVFKTVLPLTSRATSSPTNVMAMYVLRRVASSQRSLERLSEVWGTDLLETTSLELLLESVKGFRKIWTVSQMNRKIRRTPCRITSMVARGKTFRKRQLSLEKMATITRTDSLTRR